MTQASRRTTGPTKPKREQKKAATREALLEAATKVFARQGYVSASVDEVAWEAGLTKGAVYSNFASKDALFAAVIERYHDRRILELLNRVDWSAPALEQAAWAGEQLMTITIDPDLFMLILEYTLHAARFPTGQEPMRAGQHRLKAAVIEHVTPMAAGLDWDMQAALPVPDLVTAFFAMADGVALQQLSDPDGCPADLYAKMLTIFVRGLIAAAEDTLTSSTSSSTGPDHDD
jgi:AcrR family transcriptional regulator